MAWIRELPSGRLQACYRDPVGGIKTKSFGPREKGKARAWGKQQEAAILEGRWFNAGRITLASYLTDEWLPAVSAVSKRGTPLAPTTRQRYGDSVARIVGAIGRVRLSDLRPSHVERLRDELGMTLAPQTVGDVLRVLSQALRKAVARGLMGRNVADPDVVDRPAGKPKPLPIITPDLAGTIFGAVRGTDPWEVAASLALGVTLRREEVLGLAWSDVDLEAGRLTVRQVLTWADGQTHEGPPKSGAGARALELPRIVAEALRRHRAAQAERRLRVGEEWQDHDLVVDRGDGGPWQPPSFSTGWARFAAKAGFPEITFHGLRHGAATLMLAAGVPDPVAVRVMGHADARILRRYQEVVPQLLKDAAARMDGLLGSGG
jgi:integrase